MAGQERRGFVNLLEQLSRIGGPRDPGGLRMVATDLVWTAGAGLDVSRVGGAVLLAIAGRRAAIDELDGPGQALLRQRLNPVP